VTLRVDAIDIGASVNLQISNNFDVETPYDLLDTLTQGSVGSIKRVYSDFNKMFKLTYTVTGGSATFKVAVISFDNAGTTRIDNAQIAVDLSAVADALGNFDSVRIGDGTNFLTINPDGSINTVVTNDGGTTDVINQYNEVTAVASSTDTEVVSYTAPMGVTATLRHAEASGSNVGRFWVTLNGTPIAQRRTYFGGDLNADFKFEVDPGLGLVLATGDVVKVYVRHLRPTLGDFEARLIVAEKV
jgi:hypothetical protein